MRLTKANLARYNLPTDKTEALLFDDEMPGFGLRVRAGGKRTWIAQYRLGAKQRRVTLGSTVTVDPEEARRRAREALAKVSLGGDPQSEKRAAKEQASVTLGSVLSRYLAFAAHRQRAAYHSDVRRYLERHWGPLSEVSVNSVSRASVSSRLAAITADHGPFAANRARATLSAFYGWAMAEGIASANPVVGTNKAVDEKARERVLTDPELASVWQLAGAWDFGAIVRLLILTGQRRDEVGGMTWSEVAGDLWRVGAMRAKNGRANDVPLSALALQILGTRQRQDGRDLVFGAGSGPFQGWSNAKGKLDHRIAAANGGRSPDSQPWRLHDIRRTVATRMADLGVLPHVIEAVLNHVSGHKAGVAGVYNRATYAAEKRAALELWAAHVAKLVGEGAS